MKIHQIFFSWEHGGSGLAVSAHSFTDPAEARSWQFRLNSRLRLQPLAGNEPPDSALSYLHSDGSAVVLHRVSAGNSPGRNNSHALIGPTDALTPLVALGLNQWPGWQERPGSQLLDSYPTDNIASFSEDSVLRSRALGIEQKIRTVLARLLDEPNAPLSVIGCPDKDRLALLWGLHVAAEDYLRKYGVRRRWTFSTYENQHDVLADSLPEIVFLPANPVGGSTVRRTIVDFGRASEAKPENMDRAAQLLAGAFRGVAVRVSPLAPEYATGKISEIPTPGQPISAAKPAEPVAPPAPTHQHPAKTLAMVTTMREFDGVLAQLETLAQFQDNRKVMRDVLTASTLNSATAFVEEKATLEPYVRLLKAAYGQNLEDLQKPDAVDHAVSVVRASQSETLARLVGQAGAAKENARIIEAGFDRWTAGRPKGAAATPRRIVRGRKLLRFQPSHLWIAVALVATWATIFLLGIQAGEPDQATASAPATKPSTTSPPQQITSPVPALTTVPAAAFEVRDDPAQTADKEVVAFLRTGEVYYPQGLCAKGNGTWQCMTNGTHQVPAGVTADPIALAVPAKSLPELIVQAAKMGQVARARDWSSPLAPQ